MNIVGIDRVVLGVEEMAETQRFLTDFGLTEREHGVSGSRFTTQDGTDLVLRGAGDTSLPHAVGSPVNARETIWGVASTAELERIGDELSRDRQVKLGEDNVLRSMDDTGFGIAFQVTQRASFDAQPALANVCGLPPQRGRNQRVDFTRPVRPRSLGHIVFFVPDLAAAQRFYMDRLGFRLTDSYRGRSAFLRAAGSNDHHNLFLIQRPGQPGGLHHIECHVTDFNEVMMGGTRLANRGWVTQTGPGRHVLGSNYFWYFKTPFGAAMELAADMDWVDDEWQAGEWEYSPEMVAVWTTSLTRYGH
ncbi:MAG: VOC family protein [Acidisphaera sp.]|nr:VOC family protein [Acidisphaera sp.]MBV9811806.1 VOC family protein [Acetobacteraceae bacterium]